MLYVHENNFKTKIKSNYNGKSVEISDFYNNEYLPMRNKINSLDFNSGNLQTFEDATKTFNDYYNKLINFSKANGIKSQSKFESTFLEEISIYLFKNLDEIKSEKFDFFNKGIYAGLKIDADNRIEIIKKDVDFCIGKKSNVVIDNQSPIVLILPIIAVEVKTYLDATMFGEVKSSSKSIRSASPNSKTYVLMGYKSIADEHIISARQDSTLTEIFVLRKNETSPMDYNAVYEYWKEIKDAVKNISTVSQIFVPGKLLRP